MRLPYDTVSAEEQAHLIALDMEACAHNGAAPLLVSDPVWVALDVLRTHDGWVPMYDWVAETADALWLSLGGEFPLATAYRLAVGACGHRVFSLRHHLYDRRNVRHASVVVDHGIGPERVMRARRFAPGWHPPLMGTRWSCPDDRVPPPPVRLTYAPAPVAPAGPRQLSLLEAA